MRAAILFLAMIVVLTSGAQAQSSPPLYGTFSYVAQRSPTGSTVINVAIEIGERFEAYVSEIRVSRRTNGVCGSTVLIGSTMVEPLMVGEYAYEYTDPEPVGARVLSYWASLRDADGNDLGAFSVLQLGEISGVVSDGVTLAGQGYMRSQNNAAGEWAFRSDQDSPILEPCADSCWMGLYLDPADPAVLAYIDTDIPVLVTGEIECTGIWGCYLTINEVYPVECSAGTPAQSQSWGALKSRY